MLDPSIDFEFRSGTDIGLGLPLYFADREAAVLCMAWTFDDGERGLFTPQRHGRLARLLAHVEAGGRVRAWNAAFEWHCWNLFCVPLYGFPPLSWEQCVDSMAEAAAMNLPQALDNCGAALGLPTEFRKSKRGKELIKLLCIPQPEPEVRAPETYARQSTYKAALTRHATWEAKGGRWLNDPALLQELYDYCEQDVVAEVAISRKLRRLSEKEQRYWVLTQQINQRGVPVARDEIAKVDGIVRAEVERLNGELCTLTDGAVAAATEVAALREWCNARLPTREVAIESEHVDEASGEVTTGTLIVHEPYLADMQAETIERALAVQDMAPDVKRALEIRQGVGQTSTAKLGAMLKVCAPDGTLKGMHVFHGASTGRDASRGGVNLQNLMSPPDLDLALVHEVLATGDHDYASLLYGDELMAACAGSVRGMLKAPDGYEYTDGDLSSIENRVSAWIAGQDDVVQAFRDGLDEYKVFATRMFSVAYEDVTPKQRKQAKPGVLGGMFGQGWRGLIGYAAKFGVFLTDEQSQSITNTYREQYHKVKSLWYRCGDAAIEAVREPGTWFKAGEKLKLKKVGNFLWLKLPSGRVIAWAAPIVERQPVPWDKTQLREVVTVMQVDSVTKQWTRDKLIGSSIFQSAVQATARDILFNGMENVEAAGYSVRLRIHDELLSCNPIGFGSVEEFVRLMCINPEWCADLPLAGEGWRGPRFRK